VSNDILNFTPADVSPALFRAKNLTDQLITVNQPYTAQSLFNQLVQRIQSFEASLEQTHEVGMRLVHFGQSLQFSVSNLGYMDPSLIWFEGILADGSTVELIQHVSQISFLLMAVKRQNPDEPKNQIGFCINSRQSPESCLTAEQEVAASTEHTPD
jgi:hypothetical protein